MKNQGLFGRQTHVLVTKDVGFPISIDFNCIINRGMEISYINFFLKLTHTYTNTGTC